MAKITAQYRLSALRRGIIVKPNSGTPAGEQLAKAAVVELANLGFLVKPEELSTLTTKNLDELIKDARKVIGADRKLKPVYPGFPKQVQELSTLTLLVEQILHYWSFGALIPDYPEVVREGLPLEDMLRNARELRVLSAAATARELIRELATSSIALSEDDKALLEGAMALQHPELDFVREVAAAAHNGENLQSFVKGLVEHTAFTPAELVEVIAPHADNADQLLRVILAVASEPSNQLHLANYRNAVDNLADRHARAVRMKKISRPARRAILRRLGELTAGFKADSLLARQDLWRGVFRAIHPYDLSPSEAEKRALDIVHENVKYRTLNSLVEEAMAKKKLKKAVKLLSENQPGNLLRRGVALLRIVRNESDAVALGEAIQRVAPKAALTTLISAYNGMLSANDDAARVTRVAGLTNTMVDRAKVAKVNEKHLKLVLKAVKGAIKANLALKKAPAAPVAVDSKQPVPLVRRDASTADRVLDRGQELAVAGSGDVLRIFGHFNNNQGSAGYMDIGVVILDEKFEHVAVSTWDTWSSHRDWSTYSGDTLVYPGGEAAEFIDVDLKKLQAKYSKKAAWAAMTIQSWSGWPIANVDLIAGAMLRSKANKGEVFDARSVTTAFKPTTESTQSVPFAVNLKTGALIWIDSSNGSTASGTSSSGDSSIGSIVYDEIARPRLTMGQLMKLWAKAHGLETVKAPVDRELVLGLLD